MTDEELDLALEDDWNTAVDSFAPPDTEDDDDGAFQSALREMVWGLQRQAFQRGYNAADDGTSLILNLDIGQSKDIVRAMLNDERVKIHLLPFQ